MSAQSTSLPSQARSQRWEPKKPAPPVTCIRWTTGMGRRCVLQVTLLSNRDGISRTLLLSTFGWTARAKKTAAGQPKTPTELPK
jgi:hypothetical protein